MGRWPKGYSEERKILQHVQATRIAGMTWTEARSFLQSKGIDIGENKFYETRKFLEESTDDRISHIAQSEFADTHVKLIDNANDMIELLRNLVEKSNKEGKDKTLRWALEETRHYTELLKDLYAASPIVGRTQDLIRRKLAEAEEIRRKAEDKLEKLN